MYAEHLPGIIQAMQEQRLCIFIGAGVSKSSGDLPGWEDIVNALKSELNDCKEQDFLKIAQLYFLEFGEKKYYERIQELFSCHYVPSTVHHLILQLEPEKIITTNWDSLLEQTVTEGFYLYDTIVNDQELSESTLPKKIIKMHGDFNHRNIVFKEDDYLNYEYNFPLLSNYIKGILSSHTILFLGYSFNDIDLKLITTWIKNNSSSRHPLYLAEFEEKPAQIKYLEHHHISTLILPDVAPYDGVAPYTSRVMFFLKNLHDYDNIIRNINDIDPIDFVYKKLTPLSSLDYVWRNQIIQCLTQCGFEYFNDATILIFYNQIKTYDANTDLRLIYQRFVNHLYETTVFTQDELIKLNTIFEIIFSAGIHGISSTFDETSPTTSFVYLDVAPNSKLHKLFAFDYQLMPPENTDTLLFNSNICALRHQYFEGLAFAEKSLTSAIAEKNYSKILLSASNYNDIRQILNNIDKKDGFNSAIKKVEKYYSSLPISEQKNQHHLYSSINNTTLYKLTYFGLKALDKAKEKKISGNFYYNKDELKHRQDFKNMMHYYIGNSMTMTLWTEFKTAVKLYIEAAFTLQYNAEKISFNREEIYSMIRFYNNRELDELFKNNLFRNSHYMDLINIDVNVINWLINDALVNLINTTCKTLDESQCNIVRISNIFRILAFVRLDTEQTQNLFNLILRVIQRPGAWLMFYEAINYFAFIQKNVLSTKLPATGIKLTIESLIEKCALGKSSFYDMYALEHSILTSFYHHLTQEGYFLENVSLFHAIADGAKEKPIRNRIHVAKCFMLPFHSFADTNIIAIFSTYFDELINDIKAMPNAEGLLIAIQLCEVEGKKRFYDAKAIFSQIRKSGRIAQEDFTAMMTLSGIAEALDKKRGKAFFLPLWQKIDAEKGMLELFASQER